MTTRRILLSAFALSLVLFGAQANTACGFSVGPVYDVNHAAVATTSGQPATPELVRAAILRGLAAKRWTVVSDQPGTLVATVTSREHTATIRIDYTAAEYSIHHQESTPGLKYDGTKIHKLYNNWVKMLNNAIIKALNEPEAATAGGAAPVAPAPVDPAAAPAPAP